MNINEKDQFQHMLDNSLYHHFQPITDIHDSKILGYEGLLRSSCTKNPESLFNTAINLKKIFELDLYSINTAIQTFNDYVDKTTSNTHLFLNIYPTTLVSPNFINILCDRIENSKITPNCLVLEINELEQIEDYAILKETVDNLKSLGFKVALDDFDKGIAPFKKIIELEPNYIKIDKYFSNNLSQSIKKQKLLDLLLNYCSFNNIKIILEGIETDNDLSTANSLGIDFVQGFLMGKPDKLSKLII